MSDDGWFDWLGLKKEPEKKPEPKKKKKRDDRKGEKDDLDWLDKMERGKR